MANSPKGKVFSFSLYMGQPVFRAAAAPAKPGRPMLHAGRDHRCSTTRVFHLWNLRNLRLIFLFTPCTHPSSNPGRVIKVLGILGYSRARLSRFTAMDRPVPLSPRPSAITAIIRARLAPSVRKSKLWRRKARS